MMMTMITILPNVFTSSIICHSLTFYLVLYIAKNFNELLDALYCVGETLVALGKIGIMHRDIRWANVFHALGDNNSNRGEQQQSLSFTREWILFDFEYAACSPQDAFPAHTLTPGNHAPEMILHPNNDATAVAIGQEQKHDTSVDVWGFGYLIQHSMVDIPESHFDDIKQLQDDCLEINPVDRPSALECLERIRILQARPQSKEKDLQ